MEVAQYYWYQRAKCGTCNNYIWTTENNQSVMCLCLESSILNGQLFGDSQIVSNELEFKQAVMQDDPNVTEETTISQGI